MNKINVVGTSGSGKSTFSRRLADALQYPYIEMDKIYWKPNWTEPGDEEFFPKLKAELDKPNWVLDGNYNRAYQIKWEKVDMVIWLDYSFTRTLFQSITRSIKRACKRNDLWEGTGNKESFRRSFFSKDSIIWWTITTHGQVRKRYESMISDPRFKHIKFVRIKSHRQADELIESLRNKNQIL